MIADMNDPKSRKVFGLWSFPSCTPRPLVVPGVKLAMIGLMMLVVNAVMSMLNARAITSPTAMTITSPRRRKFLKPLIVMSPLRAAVIQVWFSSWTFALYLGYLLPLLSVASNHVNDRHRKPGN